MPRDTHPAVRRKQQWHEHGGGRQPAQCGGHSGALGLTRDRGHALQEGRQQRVTSFPPDPGGVDASSSCRLYLLPALNFTSQVGGVEAPWGAGPRRVPAGPVEECVWGQDTSPCSSQAAARRGHGAADSFRFSQYVFGFHVLFQDALCLHHPEIKGGF